MTKRFPLLRGRRRIALVAALILSGSFTLGGTLWACADSFCDPDWRLDTNYFDCAGRATLNPGNDTRINMIWLMRSLRATASAVAMPSPREDERQFGQTFMSWVGLRDALWPQTPAPPAVDKPLPACEASAAGVAAFDEALADESGLSPAEREALGQLRPKIGCGDISWDVPAIRSQTGRSYLAYLQAAHAFYTNDWAGAQKGFAALTRARSRWVAETATYMPIRIGLRSAVADTVDEYGDFAGTDKADAGAVANARAAVAAYLKAYPRGRYAISAQGLTRRITWLSGDTTTLAHNYEHLLATTPGDDEAAADLAEEIDIKLLDREDASTLLGKMGDTPLLLAISDLKRMRRDYYYEDGKPTGRLAASELAAQKGQFAAHADLYGLLDATRAFYANEDPRALLARLPDAARASSYTPLAFSRQMLRGMLLAKTKDPNEAGFWRDLMGGASPLYQRPLAELGLALRWQNDGKLNQIFAAGSPIDDSMIRELLLQTLATPAILRTSAKDASRPRHERDVARFTLLYKDLTNGAYADFGPDLSLVPPNVSTDAWLWDFTRQDEIPFALFRTGKWSDGYPCASITQTAATLARTPTDRKALLCLGDFYRLNNLDGFSLYKPDAKHEFLGVGPDGFPGKRMARSEIYAAIIADKRADPDDRAYALYRAVMCYAPSGYNGCGGPYTSGEDMDAAQAPQSDRKAWFTELKQRYPDSRWAKSLRYYW